MSESGPPDFDDVAGELGVRHAHPAHCDQREEDESDGDFDRLAKDEGGVPA